MKITVTFKRPSRSGISWVNYAETAEQIKLVREMELCLTGLSC